jgi:hypothetical protein
VPRGRRTGVWLAAGAVLVGGAGAVVALNVSSADGGGDNSSHRPPVVHTSVDSLGLSGASSGERLLGARSTKPFRMLAVSWSNTHAGLDGTVQVKTRSSATGRWSGWQRLAAGDGLPDPAERDRAGVRGATAPLWTGPSDGVQVRVRGAHGARALPAGLTVDLVNPGGTHASTRTGDGGRAAGAATPALEPAGFRADGEPTPSDPPTETASPAPQDTPTPTASDPAPPSDSAPASPGESTPEASAGSPTGPAGTASPASPTTAPTTTPSTAPSTPGYLPSLSAAYPSCPGASAAPQTVPSPMPAAPRSSKVPAPPIVSRTDWGADECARDAGYPDYGSTVKVAFVHHTDTTNTYSCSESPAIVRGLYALHLHQGWRDLGYNFLVDKCGTVFEGRFGGSALPVVGAQTYGFNTNSLGIAAIGTYTDLSGGDSTSSTIPGAAPTQAMTASIARIAAWKLNMAGVSPTATSTLTEGAKDSYGFTYDKSYTLNAVSGHRNGFATDCPGNQLYTELADIRTYAAGPATGLAVTAVDGPYGTTKTGPAYVTGTKATVRWTTTTPATLLTGTEVLVDGTTAARTAGGTLSAAVTLTAGRHTLQIRATHISGRTTTSPAATVIADTTKPTYPTAPSAALRTGTVNTAAIPLTVTWKATDDNGLHAQAATSPAAASLTASAAGWSTTAKAATSTRFALKATDLAGNTATASVTRTATLFQESAAKATGSWSKRSSASYLGGYSTSSSTAKASLTWTFKGRSVAWIASRATTSGQAKIYLDGTYQSTVDLKSATTQYRQALWTKTWSSTAQHTLKIVVVGTSGRPTVTTDGIAVLG